jgi:Gas vesicle synthesis protein GvpL/GvpF
MPILLYCITQPNEGVNIASGVCDCPVQSLESAGLRVYWSEIPNPEVCLAGAESLKKAALQFHQVLREILAVRTPIPFCFPTVLESAGTLDQYLAAEQKLYCAALARIGNAVQYEIVVSWVTDEQADLATPVRGWQYAKRRQESTGRIAAVDSKLKSVTGDSVREWRERQERKIHRWFALVPRDRREQFIALLRSASPSEGVRLRLSGPWPPSEFIKPQSGRGVGERGLRA